MREGIKIYIVNHALNQSALDLAAALRACFQVELHDSGSVLSDDERRGFDHVWGNIGYAGLINTVCDRLVELDDHQPVGFICSDVSVSNPRCLRERVLRVFENPRIALYAPSSTGSNHPQMHPRRGGGLRRVSFVDGFCFFVRASIFREVCPIDLERNRLGWGIDKQFGYVTACGGALAVVDNAVTVGHPNVSGYGRDEASRQRDEWLTDKSRAEKLFQKLATNFLLRDGIGAAALAGFIRKIA